MTHTTRRRVLTGAAGVTVGLTGCTTGSIPGRRESPPPDRTLYVGAFHWGFVVLTEDGARQDSVSLPRGSLLRLVAVNVEAEPAVETLPDVIRANLPDHEALEAANDADIPAPPTGTLDERRADANRRYPDHSVSLVPSGDHGSMMGRGGMMSRPIFLAHDAPRPVQTTIELAGPAEYSLRCLTDCGYGHPYMDVDDAVVVP